MNNWISVKDKLPEHGKTVLIYCINGQAVCIFIDTLKMNLELYSRGLPTDGSNIPYRFCSQEIEGNVVNGVTHWMPLPELSIIEE